MAVPPPALPSLLELRGGQSPRRASQPPAPPIPGDIAAGVEYKPGTLPVSDEAVLYTDLLIQGTALGNLPDYIYATATNRTEKGIEAVGYHVPGYYDSSGLALWDWSCMPSYPCQGGETSPGFVIGWAFAHDLKDYIATLPVPGPYPHYRKIVAYANVTKKLDTGTPPLWVNAVYLWNFSTFGGYDLVYAHEYRVDQQDCNAQPKGVCGWWGPIIEVFTPPPQPEIWELGFNDSSLQLDGVLYPLTPAYTDWDPPWSPWQEFYRLPNYTWGVGTYY